MGSAAFRYASAPSPMFWSTACGPLSTESSPIITFLSVMPVVVPPEELLPPALPPHPLSRTATEVAAIRASPRRLRMLGLLEFRRERSAGSDWSRRGSGRLEGGGALAPILDFAHNIHIVVVQGTASRPRSAGCLGRRGRHRPAFPCFEGEVRVHGVVFLGDRQLELREFPDPTPGPGEVVVAIRASGLCGSDLHRYRASAVPEPERSHLCVTGHEPAGVVVAVGAGLRPEQATIGDRVMVNHYSGCGTCEQCRSGWPQMCVRIDPIVYGTDDHGSHAAYMKVPASTLVGLDP